MLLQPLPYFAQPAAFSPLFVVLEILSWCLCGVPPCGVSSNNLHNSTYPASSIFWIASDILCPSTSENTCRLPSCALVEFSHYTPLLPSNCLFVAVLVVVCVPFLPKLFWCTLLRLPWCTILPIPIPLLMPSHVWWCVLCSTLLHCFLARLFRLKGKSAHLLRSWPLAHSDNRVAVYC